MSERRYRIIFTVKGEPLTREILLESEKPIHDIHYWLEGEYEFRANLKKIYWLREDGVAEQVA